MTFSRRNKRAARWLTAALTFNKLTEDMTFIGLGCTHFLIIGLMAEDGGYVPKERPPGKRGRSRIQARCLLPIGGVSLPFALSLGPHLPNSSNSKYPHQHKRNASASQGTSASNWMFGEKLDYDERDSDK
jgi:hypothetical protein